MKKFEYVSLIESPIEKTWKDKFKEMGEEGWECISVTPTLWNNSETYGLGASRVAECQYFFKREIE